MSWVLTRYAYLPTATLGTLDLGLGLRLYTIERPWSDNEPFVSCIPDGTYLLEWDLTGRIRNVPRLVGVPGRTQINIHKANFARELHGCIAVGMDWRLDPDPMVMDSERAMLLLNEQVQDQLGGKLLSDLKDSEDLGIGLVIRSYEATSRFGPRRG